MNAEGNVSSHQNIYHIRVRGKLDPQWSHYFNEMTITCVELDPIDEPSPETSASIPQTILSGPVRDQAALRGLLNKLWDLNLELISLETLSETI